MKQALVRFVGIFLLSSIFISCKENALDLGKAKNISGELLESIKESDYSVIDRYYSKNIYRRITKEEWVKDNKTLATLVGEIENFEVLESEVISGANQMICLKYLVKRTKYPTVETLYVRIEDEEIRIVSHEITNEHYNASMIISTEDL